VTDFADTDWNVQLLVLNMWFLAEITVTSRRY
jgi:hypothetical protein